MSDQTRTLVDEIKLARTFAHGCFEHQRAMSALYKFYREAHPNQLKPHA